MRSIIRQRPRVGVALILVLGLLGMGMLDAEVCLGSDGHLGIDTRLASCCDTGVQETPAPDCCGPMAARGPATQPGGDGGVAGFLSPGVVHSSAPSLAPGPESICVDSPWTHGTPIVHGSGLASACLSGDLPVFASPSIDPWTPCGFPPSRSDGILFHLRTTTLRN